MPSTNHRDAVFRELQTLVGEYDNAVLPEYAHAHWNLDDALSDIIIRLNGEKRRVHKLKQNSAPAAVCVAS